jgi:hypothetical protein
MDINTPDELVEYWAKCANEIIPHFIFREEFKQRARNAFLGILEFVKEENIRLRIEFVYRDPQAIGDLVPKMMDPWSFEKHWNLIGWYMVKHKYPSQNHSQEAVSGDRMSIDETKEYLKQLS